MWVLSKAILFAISLTFVTGLVSGAATAQQSVWVQIEAHRSLAEAQDRARVYSRQLQDLKGYTLRSGWHALAIGPLVPGEAADILRQLRITRQIPGDSYIVDGRTFVDQFWPDAAFMQTAQPLQTAPEGDGPVTGPLPALLPAPAIAAEETPAEARQSERLLSREDRELLQAALKWEGFYNAAIDGAFGPGTRNAMAAWQQSRNYEPTGVLSTLQRRTLLTAYRDMQASLGLQPLVEDRAGIEITLPAAMVVFDRYDPPFVHFKPRNDSGVQVLLISQTGDRATLAALYDVMQTLEIVPLEGPRAMNRNSFTLQGTNSRISSYTFAATNKGQIKGFTLIWPADADQRARAMVLEAMRTSFRPREEAVLPDQLDGGPGAQSLDLLAGLAIRQPDRTRSGFYISPEGLVLTSADAVAACERLTLDDTYEARVLAVDAAAGLALLEPAEPLRPIRFAKFLTTLPRLKSEVAVAGYSFGGKLGAPTLTYGELEELQGLRGEPNLKRLALRVTESDVGGPVFDGHGAVLGLLLPGLSDGAHRLPEDVEFATDTAAIVEFLSSAGVAAVASEATDTIAPEDLTTAAADMTVLVSCWN